MVPVVRRLRLTRASFARAVFLAVLLVPSLADGATAGRAWCRTDPLVFIDDSLADIIIAGPIAAPLLVTGPNEVVVTVPMDVRAKVVLNDLGFGRGTKTTVRQSASLRETERGVEVLVKVRVPAKDDGMPVRVEFAPHLIGILWPASAEGTANEWITLRTEF